MTNSWRQYWSIWMKIRDLTHFVCSAPVVRCDVWWFMMCMVSVSDKTDIHNTTSQEDEQEVLRFPTQEVPKLISFGLQTSSRKTKPLNGAAGEERQPPLSVRAPCMQRLTHKHAYVITFVTTELMWLSAELWQSRNLLSAINRAPPFYCSTGNISDMELSLQHSSSHFIFSTTCWWKSLWGNWFVAAPHTPSNSKFPLNSVTVMTRGIVPSSTVTDDLIAMTAHPLLFAPARQQLIKTHGAEILLDFLSFQLALIPLLLWLENNK